MTEQLTFQIVWTNYLGHPIGTTVVQRPDLGLAVRRAAWMMLKGKEPVGAHGFHVSQGRR